MALKAIRDNKLLGEIVAKPLKYELECALRNAQVIRAPSGRISALEFKDYPQCSFFGVNSLYDGLWFWVEFRYIDDVSPLVDFECWEHGRFGGPFPTEKAATEAAVAVLTGTRLSRGESDVVRLVPNGRLPPSA